MRSTLPWPGGDDGEGPLKFFFGCSTGPIGGVRLFKLGKLPINTSIQAFDNIEIPEDGADWTLRLQVQFLFPK